MKTALLMAAITAGLVASVAQAADNDDRGRRGPERPGFEQLDLNGDGQLTLEELQGQHEARFAEMDANGDGTVTAEELAAKMTQAVVDRAAKMVERLDENGDGVLQADEMEPGERRGNMAERMFGHADANEDGVVTAEEFEAAMEDAKERGGRRGGN